jgi:hypothetical protein
MACQGLVGVGLPGNREADVVHGAQGGVAVLQRLVTFEQVAGKPIDQPERVPGGDDRNDGHDAQDEEGVERKGQHRVEKRVAERLHDADEEDRTEDDGPAAARVHPASRLVDGPPVRDRDDRTHPFGRQYAPDCACLSSSRPLVLPGGTAAGRLAQGAPPQCHRLHRTGGPPGSAVLDL